MPSVGRFTKTYAHNLTFATVKVWMNALYMMMCMNSGYTTTDGCVSSPKTHNREEGTQLRSTGPRSARPCWIDGPQQQDSSDELGAGVLEINTVYSVADVLPSCCQRSM
jgi:hypothetical protein